MCEARYDCAAAARQNEQCNGGGIHNEQYNRTEKHESFMVVYSHVADFGVLPRTVSLP